MKSAKFFTVLTLLASALTLQTHPVQAREGGWDLEDNIKVQSMTDAAIYTSIKTSVSNSGDCDAKALAGTISEILPMIKFDQLKDTRTLDPKEKACLNSAIELLETSLNNVKTRFNVK